MRYVTRSTSAIATTVCHTGPSLVWNSREIASTLGPFWQRRGDKFRFGGLRPIIQPVADGRDVQEVREEIDSIDAEIVHFLVRRAELAREIGSLKGKTSEPYFTP
ncbi:MAG: chorismate mutase, partial [Fimbriimonadaceae bacterium]